MIVFLAQPKKIIHKNRSTVMGSKQKPTHRGLLMYVGVLCKHSNYTEYLDQVFTRFIMKVFSKETMII